MSTGTVIDCHAHNFDPKDYPSEVFFSRYSIPKPVIKYVLKHKQPWWAIVEYIGKYVFKKTIRLRAIVDILEEGFGPSAELFKQKMKRAGVDQACILMMDMGFGLPGDQSIYRDTVKHFKDYLLNDNTFIPFVGVDPRRSNMAELLTIFINMGFMGVKMYPPLGYSPDYKSKDNPPWLNKNLFELYTFCSKNKVPITAHTSPGGIRGFGSSPRKASRLAHPIEWFNVLNDFPKLKVNLAHYGGNSSFTKTFTGDFPDSPPKVYKTPWANIIRFYSREFGNVWGDIAFHDNITENPSTYSQAIREACSLYTGDRVLFGTDYPLHEIIVSYNDLIGTLKDEMDPTQWKLISQINPHNFLYE